MADDGVHGKMQFGPFELSRRERILRRDGQVLSLGGRALDILIYLVERPGEVIAKEKLINHVWSNVTVEPGSLRVHVAAIRKALGDGQFGNRYIANVKTRGYSFVGTVVPLVAGAESRSDECRHHGRLPARPMMIGRETVVGEVVDKLREQRLVTLLGPGGIGKTTIALAVGHAAAEGFGGAVHFVDFGNLTDPRHLAGTIAASLGVALKSKNHSLELVDLVRSRRLLIILDGCEHAIEAVASLSELFYRHAENIHVLVTSREMLKIEGEHCYPVLPLDCPPEGSSQSATTALRYSATQLFVQGVAARTGGFVLTDDQAPFVAEICRRLDGMPLAIDMAVGQVAALGIKSTAARLASRPELLKLGRRTAISRHRTLRATLDWSHDLLSEIERIVLRRIAIFIGHFILEAAQRIAAEPDSASSEIADGIAGLHEKSLLSTRLFWGQPQYRLLNTTRAYALEKLQEHGEVGLISLRHAEYVVEQSRGDHCHRAFLAPSSSAA